MWELNPDTGYELPHPEGERMKPATGLPWTLSVQNNYIAVYADRDGDTRTVVRTAASKRNRADAEFVVHACNAYPRLVAYLTENALAGDERSKEMLAQLAE